jgi:hypothetical protein
MALVLADRVKENSSTTGTGTFTLTGAQLGFQSFAVVGNANTTYYTIQNPGTSEWEVGIGTYTSANTTIARTTVLSSSNSNSVVNFSSGTKDVFVTYPSQYAVTTVDTATLTNKRVTPRVSTATSSATPTINTDNVDIYGLTAQAVDITSFSTNLSGTPTNGQKLWIYIVGTAARAITWGASFESSTIILPTTTVSTNRLDIGFVWNAVTSKWRCVAYA